MELLEEQCELENIKTYMPTQKGMENIPYPIERSDFLNTKDTEAFCKIMLAMEVIGGRKLPEADDEVLMRVHPDEDFIFQIIFSMVMKQRVINMAHRVQFSEHN